MHGGIEPCPCYSPSPCPVSPRRRRPRPSACRTTWSPIDAVGTASRCLMSLMQAPLAADILYERKATQIGLDEGSEEGVLVVIESDYPIIFSSPLTESLSFCLLSCFSSVSCFCLIVFSLLFSVLPVEVRVHRLPVRGSPAALG